MNYGIKVNGKLVARFTYRDDRDLCLDTFIANFKECSVSACECEY